MIACAVVFEVEPVRDILGSLLTYTLNIRMARQGWYEDNFAHFWSLAVEEQFYVFWPWLIILLPRRSLRAVITMAVLLAPAYRLSYVLSGYTNMSGLATYISTISCLDSLGIGSLLALTASERADGQVLSRRTIVVGLVACTSLMALTFWYDDLSIVLRSTAQAGLLAAVVASAARGFRGWFGRLLEWQPILYLGTISYGIYVYHPFVYDLVSDTLPRLGVTARGSGRLFIDAVTSVAATLALASLSWFLLEKPMNSLKRHFQDPTGSTIQVG